MAARLRGEKRSIRSHRSAIARLFWGTTAPNGFTTAHVPASALPRMTASFSESGSGSGTGGSSDQTAKVEGRTQGDAPAALLEPLPVEEDHREVLGYLRRVDQSHRERCASRGARVRAPHGAGHGRDHRAEPVAQLAVRIAKTGKRGGDGPVEEDCLRLAARGIAIQLAHDRALGGEEDVGPRDAVPVGRRRAPQGLLHRREPQEPRDERGIPGAVKAELVVRGCHLLCRSVERCLLGRGEHDGPGMEPGLTLEPRVGNEAARGEACREVGILPGTGRRRHAISVSRTAAARYETASTALTPTLRSCATSRSRPPPRKANGWCSISVCTTSCRTGYSTRADASAAAYARNDAAQPAKVPSVA